MKTLLLICCIACCASGYGQHISLKETNEPLTKVFHDLEKITGYQFFFADSDLKNAKRISFDVKNDDLTDILNICFRNQPLTYSISGSTVMIKLKDENLKKNESLNNTAENIINGHVTDSSGNALAGASVIIKGSDVGTTTNNSGDFVINIVKMNATILISYTGYSTKKLFVRVGDPVNVSLAKSISPLDEIQVIAYGSVSKRLNTGDVTSITSKVIGQQPVTNPLLALEGLVPGMEVQQATGLPGSAVTIQIRGQNSISNGNDPLYIIDGVPYASENLPGISTILGTSNTTEGGRFSNGSPFSYINPSDIESIDILKDADATAIYGSRGANGVVLITTKKGKSGQTRADINMQSGWGKVADKMNLLNTPQYLQMRNQAFKNDGATPDPNADFDLTLWDTTRYTDWQKQLIGGTAQFTNIHATVSGGNTNTQFLIGAGYNKQSTVFPGDFNDQRGSVNFNINNTSPNQRFKIQLSGIYSADNNHLCAYDLTSQALQLAPVAPAMYNSDGSINWEENASGVSTWPGYNPAAMLLDKYTIKTNNLVSNAVLSYRVIPGLDIKSSFGYTNTQSNEIQTIPLISYSPSARSYSQRSAVFADNSLSSWIVEPQIVFTRNISKGILTALLGTTIEQSSANTQLLSATGFSSDLVLENLSAATVITPNTSVAVYKYNALFGRLNYNWQDKYLVNLTARRDGSSRFGPQNQFHNFGAVGLAWIFTKEQSIHDKLSFLSFGKLRGSFGTTGSDQVGDYTFMDQYVPINFGVPYQGVNGYAPNRIFSPNLSWEETKKLEAGLELGFLKDRILFGVSFYQNRSSNQLLSYLLPAISGFTSVEKNLNATVQNMGWEFELKTVNIRLRNFQWTSSFNLSLNRNKLVSGAPGLSDFYNEKIGYPISSTFVYHFLGVNPITGVYQFADNKGTPTPSPNPLTDATSLIDNTIKFYGGLSNAVNYEGFQLDFLFQFVSHPMASNYLYSYIPGSFSNSFGGNQPVDVMNRWQAPGDVSNIQRFSQNLTTYNSINNARQSDQIYSDASFIRLKNVSLSWQFPQQMMQNIHLQNARIYMLAQNLLMFTNYKGLDPETLSSGTLPPLRVITFGIQVGL